MLQVDFNVTRHLDEELHSKKDWDVMILHYLGLDHVGHLVGPASDLMAIKLTEMDSVISTIFDSLKHEVNNNSNRRSNTFYVVYLMRSS